MVLCDLIRILYDFVCCENGMREWNVGMVCVLFSYLGKVRANVRTLPKRFELFIPTLVSRENVVPWRISWGSQF